MSAVTDDAVLAVLKRDLDLRDVIATAATMKEAEKLSLAHFGMLLTLRTKAALIRQHLENEAADDTAAEIIH